MNFFVCWLSLSAVYAAVTYPDNSPPAGVDIWCGKAYRATSVPFTTLVDAGWQFPPPKSFRPLLEFTCRPRLKPYVEGADSVSFMVVARISHDVGTLLAASLSGATPQKVSVSIVTQNGNYLLSSAPVSLSENPTEVNVLLEELPPTTTPYRLTCIASDNLDGLATAETDLFYLPSNPYGGSTVQVDSLTNELVVTKAKDITNHLLPKRFFPVGYFISWGDFLQKNFTHLQEIKEAGYTIVHPVPGGGTAEEAWGSLDQIVSFMEAAADVGLWVMYDMRHTYKDPTQLLTQITTIRSLSSLLLWYTADEPDGNNDPTNSTKIAYDLINTQDGYHPVSLVLNCQNYFFAQYTSGADIISPDVYPVGNNVTFSSVYNTPCNRTYGDCGCDNCVGTLHDLSDRLIYFKDLMRWQGTHKTLWGTSQALGNTSFWKRYPTEAETITIGEAAVEKGGAKGLLWWMQPTATVVYSGTTRLSRHLNSVSNNGSAMKKLLGMKRLVEESRRNPTTELAVQHDDL